VFGGPGPAGDQPDQVGQERQRVLEPRVEQTFGIEQLSQPFDALQQFSS